MISFSRLERKGHLGNQLFQIASTIGLARANNQDFAFPAWSYQDYFENSLPILSEFEDLNQFEEPQFHYKSYDLRNGHYDLNGWFQSERFFDISLAKHHFKFKDSVIDQVKAKFPQLFEKPTILISIRRGDFVDHPDYFQLPISFYINALEQHFPDWQDHQLIVTSDDFNYSKFHFSSAEGVCFPKELNAIEQLVLASLCDHFIISNSTFSWWCAWLGEKPGSKIIRPAQNFTDEKRRTHNDKDFFPDRWIPYDHRGSLIKMDQLRVDYSLVSEETKSYMQKVFQFNADVNPSNLPVLLPDDFILPPLSVVIMYKQWQSTQKTIICRARGKLLKISRELDWQSFSRQFDFGLFSRLLDPAGSGGTKEILSVLTANYNRKSWVRNNKITTQLPSAKEIRFIRSFAGKIGGILYLKYYLSIRKEAAIRWLKKRLKRLLRP